MQVLSNINSLFNSVTYRLGSTIIDPGDTCNFEGIEFVLLTHAHFDHIYGLNALFEINPLVKVYTNVYGKEMLLDERKNLSHFHEAPFVFKSPDNIAIVSENEELILPGNIMIKALFTPGHNPSCITWVTDNLIFTGDAFIPGSKTVTNLPRGDKALAKKSEEKIEQLAVNRIIYPGHYIKS